MHCTLSAWLVCRKQQTACAVNARDCLSWQPSANALHASSELTAPFLQVITCSQQQPDIMFSVLLCSGHLQTDLVSHKSFIHQHIQNSKKDMLYHVDIDVCLVMYIQSCITIWCCIQSCCVQGAPFESELEYLAYGCQGDPLVQMAVLSFQQQTALQVSTPFTQAVKNNSNNDDDDDNINNSNSRSCDSNSDTNNNINSHSDSNSNNSNDDDKLRGQLVRATGV